MEKRVVLAMLLSVGLIVAFTQLQQSLAPPPAPGVGPGVRRGTPAIANTGTTAGGAVRPAGDAPVAVPALPDDGPESTIETVVGRLHLTLHSRGAALARADAWSCPSHEPGEGDVEGDPGRGSDHFAGVPGLGAVDLLTLDSRLSVRNWRISNEGGVLRGEIDVAERGVRVVSEYRPSTDPAAPYHVDMTVSLIGLEGADGGARTALEVVGPWLANAPFPVPEDGVLVAREGEDVEILTPDDIAESLAETPGYEIPAGSGIRFIGARSDFHLGALESLDALPREAAVGFYVAARDENTPDEWRSAAASLRFPVALPRAGETTKHRFRLFLGPNARPALTDPATPYGTLVDALPERSFLGVSFSPISRVLSWLLELLASTGMGYGLAVASLTILVRGVLFPISRKSQISMRVHGKKMGALKPKMDALKAKIKDPQKQQQAIMKLMREEKVSPLPGGCLLAFVQMPIWISLYGILQTTFEMRHASFLWADDLTAPDHLLAMPWFEGVPVLPVWLNLFPVLMMITWGISSHMQPLPEDPQQRQTAKMMRWMPMAFGLILYNYPCGLTVYMTCSALWSIGEVHLIRRVWLSKL